jgi:nucleotide-binding universal stress UspA family protein
MYKKILVPLDGSKLAECSLNHVKNLLKDGPVSEVILLNAVVVDLPWKELGGSEVGMAPAFDYRALVDAAMDKAKNYLAKVQSRLSSEGLAVKTEAIEYNSPSHAITDYAQKNGVDVIIIATHGYSGMKKMLLGSVATKVLHESNVPVLLIRPEACKI